MIKRYYLYLKLILRKIQSPPTLRVLINLFRFQLNKIIKNSKVAYTPVSIIISATKRCNFTCSFCFVEEYMGESAGTSGDLTREQFNKFLATDYFKNALRVGFLGGEPLLNRNIFDYLEVLHRNKKITTIVTNSSLIKGQVLEKILNSPLDVLGLSLYDNNIDDVRRVAQALGRKKLYWIQTIITSDNLEKMEDVIKFCIEIGCHDLIFDNYYPVHDNDTSKMIRENNDEYNKLRVELDEKYSKKINITWVAKVAREGQEGMTKRVCTLPYSYIQLDNEGNIGPCCVRAPKYHFGNIYGQEGWNSTQMIKLRQNLFSNEEVINDVCKNCQCLSTDLYNI